MMNMDEPRETLTFVSPYPIEVAKHLLDDKSLPRKKIQKMRFFPMVIQTQIKEMDTVRFSMVRIQVRQGFFNIMYLPNYDRAVQHAEQFGGKVEGTLQRQPDNTTLVTASFYWGWENLWDSESLVINGIIAMFIGIGICLFSVASAFEEQSLVPIVACNGFWGCWVALNILMIYLNQLFIQRELIAKLKKILAYQG